MNLWSRLRGTGKNPARQESAATALSDSAILDALRPIVDPDFGKSIVDLGFVKDIQIDGGNVSFAIELTTPACPVKAEFEKAARERVLPIELSKAERAEADREQNEWKRRARLLVDENLGERLAGFLRDHRWNAKSVGEFGLDGHDDNAVFALAWRERRFLLTQDRDFLDSRRFPFTRNPGLIVLPKDPIDDDWISALWAALQIVASQSAIFEKAKVVVNKEREFTTYNEGEGRSRYRIESNGTVFQWVD